MVISSFWFHWEFLYICIKFNTMHVPATRITELVVSKSLLFFASTSATLGNTFSMLLSRSSGICPTNFSTCVKTSWRNFFVLRSDSMIHLIAATALNRNGLIGLIVKYIQLKENDIAGTLSVFMMSNWVEWWGMWSNCNGLQL